MSDQRREVAARLRVVTEEELRYVFLEEILNFAVGGRCLDDEGDIDERLILNRLADLIDRPTCRDVGDGWTFRCSACGCELDTDDGEGEPTMWLEGSAMTPRHCPNCGAKVTVEEGSHVRDV